MFRKFKLKLSYVVYCWVTHKQGEFAINFQNIYNNNFVDVSPSKLIRRQKFARRAQMEMRHERLFKNKRLNIDPKYN